MNNPEKYLLSHNRFIDYLVLIFVDKKGLRFIHSPIELIFNINDYLDQINTSNDIISEHLNMKTFCLK